MSRRRFLGGLGLGAAAFATRDLWERGAIAEELLRQTPWIEEGPFYPPRLPLDRDNDLVIVGDSVTPSVGEITHVSGRLLNQKGELILTTGYRDSVASDKRDDNTQPFEQEEYHGQHRCKFNSYEAVKRRYDVVAGVNS